MANSDDDEVSSNVSSDEEEAEKIQRKRGKVPPAQKRARAPEMSVPSSTKPSLSTVGQETSFDMLLAKEKARGESRLSVPQDRPNGEMRASRKENTRKEKSKMDRQHEKGDQSNGPKARRSASKNVFRRM